MELMGRNRNRQLSHEPAGMYRVCECYLLNMLTV